MTTSRFLIAAAIFAAGVAAVVVIAFLLNQPIKDFANGYEGTVALLSFCFSVALAVANFLYRYNLRFHAFCHQVLLLLRPYHTYWSFAFNIVSPADELTGAAPALVEESIEALRARFTRLRVLASDDVSARITLDETFVVRLKQSAEGLFVDSEHRFTVPSQLYDRYRSQLSTLAELVSRGSTLSENQYSVAVHFEGRSANPYYGFFVRHVPPSNLIDFHVAFRCDDAESCRVSASMDRVDLAGSSVAELFQSLRKILNYEAIPREAVDAP